MFTGLIEEVGTIKNIRNGAKSSILTVSANEILSDMKIGDSIAVNGICLTVTKFDGNSFLVDVMSETLSRTSLSKVSLGSKVNLERAMSMNGRFGGHIVSGHIDGTGVITQIENDDNAVWYRIKASDSIMKYIVEKGSIAIDGISLTVARTSQSDFMVSIIPHTQSVTTLGLRKIGDCVNLECDIIGKYVEKMISYDSSNVYCNNNSKESKVTEQFLIENGF